MKAGFAAFREAYLSAGGSQRLGERYSDVNARQLRYAILWAYFENTAYRDLHSWAKAYRTSYGLYKHVRTIYNPAFRLGSFWSSHLMGGALDPAAGDGTQEPSALPIVTDSPALRQAVATLWRDSNWATKKDVYTLRGSVLGDTAIQVVDDPVRGKVYLDVLDPGTIVEAIRDPFGNVKAYTRQEERDDPAGGKRLVTYTERVSRDGDEVVFQTLLNDTPYAWNGVAAEWSEPYGFVPLVLVSHHDVGLEWGWSELYPALGKLRESDDLASKLHDQIRKLVDAPWLFSGVSQPTTQPKVSGTAATAQRPEPGREEIPMLYGPENARATPLVAPLDITATAAEIQNVLADLERDYPELRYDRIRTSGDASAEAIREARKPAEAKVQARRAPYDAGLVKAHQMAIAIGGHYGYPGYQGFDLASYAAGQLDHRIGKRPVFAVDVLDDLHEQSQFWMVAAQAKAAGLKLEAYLEDAGWTPERIRRAVAAQQTAQDNQPDHGSA